jgi:cytochrome b561
MAVMVLAMLFIGVGMVSAVVPRYWTLVSIHRPLGIAILVLVVARIGVWRGAPRLPADLPGWQVLAAKVSLWVLHGLMAVMPLVGWSMLSAWGYPVVLYGAIHLPRIMPHAATLHALLREAHAVLAYVLFLTILVHVSAALLVRRDCVFASPRSRRQRRRPCVRTRRASFRVRSVAGQTMPLEYRT